MSRWINWNPAGVQIDDEIHTPDAAAYSLRHDAWKNLQIWTGAGATGTQLAEGTDYQLDTEKTLSNSFGESAAVHTQVQIINAAYEGISLYHSYLAVADFWKAINGKLSVAEAPAHYERDIPWKVKGLSWSDLSIIVSPGEMTININKVGYYLPAAIELRLNESATWDTITPIDYTLEENRAGKDFYIYALQPESGYVPNFVVSANSTYPTGYTEETSRKVGGFHCLCFGTDIISDTELSHPLSNVYTGAVLPQSVWDLNHRPKSEPEGMVYHDGLDLWIDIYLASLEGGGTWGVGKLVSAFNGDFVTGTTTEVFHARKFEQWFGQQRKRLPREFEFVALSLGSNQGTNIVGSVNPVTTGGHVDIADRRMISYIGVEDACGTLWQWGLDTGSNLSSSYSNNFTAHDSDVAGQQYSNTSRVILGGDWGYGSRCGSRASYCHYGALYLDDYRGARGVSEPRR